MQHLAYGRDWSYRNIENKERKWRAFRDVSESK